MSEILVVLGLIVFGGVMYRLGYAAGCNAAFKQALQSINSLFPSLPK